MKRPKRISYTTLERYFLRYIAKLCKEKDYLGRKDTDPVFDFMSFIESEINKKP